MKKAGVGGGDLFGLCPYDREVISFSAFALLGGLLPGAPMVPAWTLPTTVSAPFQAVGPAAEAEAQEALELAIAHAAKGRYRRARDSYKRIVKFWPETKAGREAESRLSDNSFFSWSDILRHGPSEARIDIVFLGDGYTFDQQDAFDDVAGDLPRIFERNTVFGEYFSYFNFLRGNVVSLEAGVDGYGRSASTALGGATLDYTNAGNTTVDRGRVHDVLREIPGSEGLAVVVVKRGSAGTGGGGVATIGGRRFDTVLHEWGHAFASLGDEYAVDRGFRHKIASTRVNVSLTENEEEVPWAHWIAAKTPGIGTYEGAAGQVRDAWRPKASGCIMNDGVLFFCEPCREALILSIYERLDPIEAFWIGDGHPVSVEDEHVLREPLQVHAQLLQPAGHDLVSEWFLIPEADAPVIREETTPRSERGPLAEVTLQPEQKNKRTKNGRVSLRLSPRDFDAGRYLLLLRVHDLAKPLGERRPWVLKDDRELLSSERGFWVTIE